MKQLLKQRLMQRKQKKVIQKRFKARAGSPFSEKDAQAIGEELEKLKSVATLNPTNIVQRANNPNSVLHNYFDWDNDIAGEKWRLQQARNIVNHVIEVTFVDGEEVEERAFFSVINTNKDYVYVSQAEAIKNISYKKQLLEDMRLKLENLLALIKLFSRNVE